MNRILRSMAAGMMSACMLAEGVLPLAAETPQDDVTVITYTCTRYADGESTVSAAAPVYQAKADPQADVYFDSIAEAGAYIREQMVNHEEIISFHLTEDSGDIVETGDAMMAAAFTHTGKGNEGDYLAFQYGSYRVQRGVHGFYEDDIVYRIILDYYTTKEQEQTVTDRLAQVYREIGLNWSDSEYTRFKKIYDYVISHVTYDYANLDNEAYTLKHTAYAALINGTSVCQGYALLMYRMLLDWGIDTRIISGDTSNGFHAWNIVGIDSLYYSIDATWEPVEPGYQYLLKGSRDFPDHDAKEKFRTDEFTNAYPLCPYDYQEGSTAVTGVSLSQNSLTLEIGETCQLNAQVNPAGANQTVLWKASDSSVYVSETGLVKAQHTGKAAVTVQTQNGNRTAVCNVNVIDSLAIPFGFVHDFRTGKDFWYENNTRQAVAGDPKNIWDSLYGVERGREIYDPASNAWYWLDSIYDGAKAVGKEVWIPYIYQDEDNWTPAQKREIAHESDHGMYKLVYRSMMNKTGKWVRYNAQGAMAKGWYTVTGPEVQLYPDQAGNTYYYDTRTGLMAKGWIVIDHHRYHFDEITGVLQN